MILGREIECACAVDHCVQGLLMNLHCKQPVAHAISWRHCARTLRGDLDGNSSQNSNAISVRDVVEAHEGSQGSSHKC